MAWDIIAIAAAFGSTGAEGSFFSINLIWSVLNFLIFIALLYLLTRRQVRELFMTRRNHLAKAIEEGQKQKEEAERLYEEALRRKETLEEEIKSIVDATSRDAEVMAQRIINNAEALAEKVRKESVRLAEGEVSRVKRVLVEEVSHIVEKRAREILQEHLRPEDHERLAFKVIEELEEGK